MLRVQRFPVRTHKALASMCDQHLQVLRLIQRTSDGKGGTHTRRVEAPDTWLDPGLPEGAEFIAAGRQRVSNRSTRRACAVLEDALARGDPLEREHDFTRTRVSPSALPAPRVAARAR
jgi:hypothetical protein